MVQEINARHKIPVIVTDENFLKRSKDAIEACAIDGQDRTLYFQTMHGTYVCVKVNLSTIKGKEQS